MKGKSFSIASSLICPILSGDPLFGATASPMGPGYYFLDQEQATHTSSTSSDQEQQQHYTVISTAPAASFDLVSAREDGGEEAAGASVLIRNLSPAPHHYLGAR